MKKYIAFITGQHSAIGTKEDCNLWAAKQFAVNTKLQEVHIAEVIEVAERIDPAVSTKQFFCKLDPPTMKPIDSVREKIA